MTEPRTRKYVKAYGILSFARKLSNKYGKHLLDTAVDALKTASKKLAEAAGEFIRNEITDKIVKPVEEIIIPPEKREEI